MGTSPRVTISFTDSPCNNFITRSNGMLRTRSNVLADDLHQKTITLTIDRSFLIPFNPDTTRRQTCPRVGRRRLGRNLLLTNGSLFIASPVISTWIPSLSFVRCLSCNILIPWMRSSCDLLSPLCNEEQHALVRPLGRFRTKRFRDPRTFLSRGFCEIKQTQETKKSLSCSRGYARHYCTHCVRDRGAIPCGTSKLGSNVGTRQDFEMRIVEIRANEGLTMRQALRVDCSSDIHGWVVNRGRKVHFSKNIKTDVRKLIKEWIILRSSFVA